MRWAGRVSCFKAVTTPIKILVGKL